jgi:hypothetical protein
MVGPPVAPTYGNFSFAQKFRKRHPLLNENPLQDLAPSYWLATIERALEKMPARHRRSSNTRRRARRSPFDCRRLSGLGWRCRVIQLRPGPLWPGLFHFNYVQVAAFGRLASGKQKVQVQALRRELDLGTTLYTPNVND